MHRTDLMGTDAASDISVRYSCCVAHFILSVESYETTLHRSFTSQRLADHGPFYRGCTAGLLELHQIQWSRTHDTADGEAIRGVIRQLGKEHPASRRGKTHPVKKAPPTTSTAPAKHAP